MGGTLLEFFKQKQEMSDSGCFSIKGSSKSHIARLASGERILTRYEADPSTLEVINESTLLFKIQSMSLPTRWYHASIQSTYCDCPDWTSDCKHLCGVRLIIQHQFPHLYGVLPIVDNAHALGLMQHNIDVDGNDQGRSEGLNIDVGGNDEGGVLNNEDGLNKEHKEGTSIDEQINLCIQDLKNFCRIFKRVALYTTALKRIQSFNNLRHQKRKLLQCWFQQLR